MSNTQLNWVDVGRIGFISDAHGNSKAFIDGVNLLKNLSADKIIFLGDSIGYIPNLDVIEMLCQNKESFYCIKGNHESMLLSGGVDDKKDDVYKLSVIKDMMPDEYIDYIRTWPCSLNILTNNINILCVHGSPKDPTFGYVYPDSELTEFNDIDADVIFMGNTHRPFIKQYNNKLFTNTGSCGLPRDNGGYGSVAMFDTVKYVSNIYRYDIKQANIDIVANYPGIHHSVNSVFHRDDVIEHEYSKGLF